MPNAPDLTQKVYGFREWQISENMLLASVTYGYEWKPGVNSSRQKSFEQKSGGFWVVKNLESARAYSYDGNSVRGIVFAWGWMAVNDEGDFQAQHAEIVALTIDKEDSPLRIALTRMMADTYKVPIVPEDRAEAWAAEHYATKIPESLYYKEPDEQKELDSDENNFSFSPFSLSSPVTTNTIPAWARTSPGELLEAVAEANPNGFNVPGKPFADEFNHIPFRLAISAESGSILYLPT